jgi:serine/threonine-protein kinase SRPK3
MVKIEDLSILDIDARSEFQNPLPQKHYEDGRTIYLSRNNYGQPHTTTGIIRITDFDLAARGDVPHKGCIQAEVYRAPEVIINAGYTYSADIWSLGTMVIPQLWSFIPNSFWPDLIKLWDLLEGKRLFEAVDPHTVDEYDDQKHLAYITALLGPPPRELLDVGDRTSMFYDRDGKFNGVSVYLDAYTQKDI